MTIRGPLGKGDGQGCVLIRLDLYYFFTFLHFYLFCEITFFQIYLKKYSNKLETAFKYETKI